MIHCFLFCTLSTALLPLYSYKVKLPCSRGDTVVSSFLTSSLCLFIHWVMLPSMLSVCPCVCVLGGGDPWSFSHIGDTSESSLLPEGPVKMQRSLCCWDRKGSVMNIFEPFKQVVFSWWPHQAVQEEGITVKKSFSRTSCCEILSWLHPLMGPTGAESAYIFMILHWRSHKAWETIHSICRQCGKRGRMRDEECTGKVLWVFP